MHNLNRVEVNLNQLGLNARNLRKKYDNYEYYIGVIKGNAYGHGYGIVNTLIENGINYLAVSNLEEARQVRAVDKNIGLLIMEPVRVHEVEECFKSDVAITVSNYEYWQQLLKIPPQKRGKIKIHLKLDTGLNRLGMDDETKVEAMYQQLKKREDFYLEGIFTHFATTGVNDDLFDKQLIAFKALTKAIDLTSIPIVHLGRSATLETRGKIPFATGVRMGAILFGINQSFRPYVGLKGNLRKIRDVHRKKKLNISDTFDSNDVDVKTALTLKTPVMEINLVKAGERVGYGGTYLATQDTKIAVCPIGYADGLHLGMRKSKASLNGKQFPIVGIINMCMITVAVDDTVSVGDFLTILGQDITMKEVAALTQSTPYVAMTQINPLIKREYIESE